jgi:hypothetical protein
MPDADDDDDDDEDDEDDVEDNDGSAEGVVAERDDVDVDVRVEAMGSEVRGATDDFG